MKQNVTLRSKVKGPSHDTKPLKSRYLANFRCQLANFDMYTKTCDIDLRPSLYF